MKKVDVAAGVFTLSLSGFYYFKITKLERRGFTSGELGPEVFPTLIIVPFAVLGGLLFVRGLIRRSETKEGGGGYWGQMAISMLSCIGYVVLLSQVGFLLATVLFLVLFVWLYGARKIWVIAAASIIPTAVIYLVFWRVFHILLP